MVISSKLNFFQQIRQMVNKVAKGGLVLSRIMANIGSLMSRRRLDSSCPVSSTVWSRHVGDSLNHEIYVKKLAQVQRQSVL